MKQVALDSSLKKLSTDALTVQIGRTESPLSSFLFVLSFYRESLGECGFITVYLRLHYKHCWIELAESYLLILEH